MMATSVVKSGKTSADVKAPATPVQALEAALREITHAGKISDDGIAQILAHVAPLALEDDGSAAVLKAHGETVKASDDAVKVAMARRAEAREALKSAEKSAQVTHAALAKVAYILAPGRKTKDHPLGGRATMSADSLAERLHSAGGPRWSDARIRQLSAVGAALWSVEGASTTGASAERYETLEAGRRKGAEALVKVTDALARKAPASELKAIVAPVVKATTSDAVPTVTKTLSAKAFAAKVNAVREMLVSHGIAGEPADIESAREAIRRLAATLEHMAPAPAPKPRPKPEPPVKGPRVPASVRAPEAAA